MIRAIRAAIAVVALALVASCGGDSSQPAPSKFKSYSGPPVTQIVVKKGDRKMYLLSGRTVLRSYDVNLGPQPVGPKEYEGDGRTPEGMYFIDRKNPRSSYHLSVGISYPSTNFFSDGPGVLLGAYPWGAYAYQWNALPAEERVAKAVEYGSQIHSQYNEEFLSGVAVGWHRVPWVLGCYGEWKDREADYTDATAMDGRTLMAGEHISYLPAWMEGAILSALDAVERLHATVTTA